MNGGPHWREWSPDGGSILMMSAPRSPSSIVQYGPARAWLKSSTRMTASGSGAAAPIAAGPLGVLAVKVRRRAHEQLEAPTQTVHVPELRLPSRQQRLHSDLIECGQLLDQRLSQHRGHDFRRLVSGRLLLDHAIHEPQPKKVPSRQLQLTCELARVIGIVIED